MREFFGHDVETIERAGFKGLENGDLLKAASGAFEVLVTVDRNIEYQQNPEKLPMAVLIISAVSNRLEHLLPLVPDVLAALDNISKGEIVVVE